MKVQWDNRIHRDWHRVDITKRGAERHVNALRWCQDNTKGNWATFSSWFKFEESQDAVAFLMYVDTF